MTDPVDGTQRRRSILSNLAKYICTMEGNVHLVWEGKQLLSDAIWMGHLFSFSEIQQPFVAKNHDKIFRGSTGAAILTVRFVPSSTLPLPPRHRSCRLVPGAMQ